VSSRTNRILGLKAFRNKGLQDIRRDIYATVGLTWIPDDAPEQSSDVRQILIAISG
jgi:hypothetical protein